MYAKQNTSDDDILEMILCIYIYIHIYIHINWLQLSAIRVIREKDTCTMCIWEDEKHWKLQQTVIFNKSNDIQRPIAVFLTVFCNNKLWFSLRYWYNVVVQGHVYNSPAYITLSENRGVNVIRRRIVLVISAIFSSQFLLSPYKEYARSLARSLASIVEPIHVHKLTFTHACTHARARQEKKKGKTQRTEG